MFGISYNTWKEIGQHQLQILISSFMQNIT